MIAGLEINKERAGGALEYRHRLRGSASMFARAEGGYEFGVGAYYGAIGGLRWEW